MSENNTANAANQVNSTANTEMPSLKTWIITLVVGIIVGLVFTIPAFLISYILKTHVPAFMDGGYLAHLNTYINLMLTFVGQFWGLVLCIHKIAKVPMKSFILGFHRQSKLDIKKEVLPIAGCMVLGLFLEAIPDFGNLSLSGISAGQFIIIVILCIVFTWMQTSWEEFVFRGFPLRIVCGDNIGINKRSFITAIITSLLFMSAHLANPEVTSLGLSIDAVGFAASYFASGFFLFLCDMLAGDLMPGLIVHFINNFATFTLISGEVSVGGATSLLVSHSTYSGIMPVLVIVLEYIPVLIYLTIKRKKNK